MQIFHLDILEQAIVIKPNTNLNTPPDKIINRPQTNIWIQIYTEFQHMCF